MDREHILQRATLGVLLDEHPSAVTTGWLAGELREPPAELERVLDVLVSDGLAERMTGTASVKATRAAARAHELSL